MKKVTVGVVFLLLFVFIFPESLLASRGLIPPTSRFYSLQTWGERVKLMLILPKDQKVDYLLSLTQRRTDEMVVGPSLQVSNRYAEHYQELKDLSLQVPDETNAVKRIKEANLNQQSVLAAVYVRVPAEAKEAVLGAQTNSSKQVASTIAVVEGDKSADKYKDQVQAILKVEMAGKVEQIPMESEPNPNPSENNINQIKGGQQLNQLNPINNQNGSGDGGQMQPAAPIPMR